LRQCLHTCCLRYHAISMPVPACVQVTAIPHHGCELLHNSEEVQGRIVLMQRGGCDFVVKAATAQYAGAKALIVMDSEPRKAGSNW
jgi:hypothetical protein